jgi:hypothetical protein
VHSLTFTVSQVSSPSPQSRNEQSWSWSWSSLVFPRAQLLSTSLSKERLVSPIPLRFFRLWHSTCATVRCQLVSLSGCHQSSHHASLVPRPSPTPPHTEAYFPHQTRIPSYQAVTVAVAATATATAAKNCQLISGDLLQAPEKENLGIRGGRTDLSQVRIPPIGAANPPPTLSPPSFIWLYTSAFTCLLQLPFAAPLPMS